MPIQTTTLQALRAAIDARVQAIVPDHTRTSSHRWRRVKAREEARGTIRGYYLSITEQQPSPEGLFASGLATYQAKLRIWTGYHSLNEEQGEDARSSDNRQLWVALSNVSGVISGLFNVVRELWEDGDDAEDGKRWGAHVFTIIFLLDQP